MGPRVVLSWGVEFSYCCFVAARHRVLAYNLLPCCAVVLLAARAAATLYCASSTRIVPLICCPLYLPQASSRCYLLPVAWGVVCACAIYSLYREQRRGRGAIGGLELSRQRTSYPSKNCSFLAVRMRTRMRERSARCLGRSCRNGRGGVSCDGRVRACSIP